MQMSKVTFEKDVIRVVCVHNASAAFSLSNTRRFLLRRIQYTQLFCPECEKEFGKVIFGDETDV